MDRLSLVLAASTLADAAGVVVFAVLSGRRRWAWAAFAAVAWLVKLVALGVAGLEPLFGTAHLVWLDVIVVVPLAGALLAVRGRHTVLRILGGLAVLLAPPARTRRSSSPRGSRSRGSPSRSRRSGTPGTRCASA